MDFDDFLSRISNIETVIPGGASSHAKMIPKERRMPRPDEIYQKSPKKAAVLALFYPDSDNSTRFLLIMRADYDGTHASQIGFPGGKFEPSDQDLSETAIRETEEEVGVHAKSIHIVKKMTETFIPPSNFLVTPFVGITRQIPQFRTNHEVEDLIEVRLSELLSDKSVGIKKISTSYMENVPVPCFVLNNMTVWGATAMMLSEIKDLIKENLH
jgi:8-oxo-dGTP pyrophosphatase MutT (NUDIX family)